MVLSRYPVFYQHMLASPCSEVSVLAELFSKDARSTTAESLSYVSAITGLNFFKCVFGHQYYTNINEHLFQKCEEQTFYIWSLGIESGILAEKTNLYYALETIWRKLSWKGASYSIQGYTWPKTPAPTGWGHRAPSFWCPAERHLAASQGGSAPGWRENWRGEVTNRVAEVFNIIDILSVNVIHICQCF